MQTCLTACPGVFGVPGATFQSVAVFGPAFGPGPFACPETSKPGGNVHVPGAWGPGSATADAGTLKAAASTTAEMSLHDTSPQASRRSLRPRRPQRIRSDRLRTPPRRLRTPVLRRCGLHAAFSPPVIAAASDWRVAEVDAPDHPRGVGTLSAPQQAPAHRRDRGRSGPDIPLLSWARNTREQSGAVCEHSVANSIASYGDLEMSGVVPACWGHAYPGYDVLVATYAR